MTKRKQPAYPGEGHPWAYFLWHRARVLVEWEREGKTPEDTAITRRWSSARPSTPRDGNQTKERIEWLRHK